MAAIIRVGTTQATVKEGDRIKVELMKAEKGAGVEISEVLALISGGETVFGKPYVDGAKVEAKVLAHGRHDKIIVFKYMPKKRRRKRQGHRQHYTELEIEKIITPGAGQPRAKAEKSEE